MSVDALVGIVFFIGLFGVIFGAIYFDYKREKALIEKGLYKPLEVTKKILIAGLILIPVSLESHCYSLTFSSGKNKKETFIFIDSQVTQNR